MASPFAAEAVTPGSALDPGLSLFSTLTLSGGLTRGPLRNHDAGGDQSDCGDPNDLFHPLSNTGEIRGGMQLGVPLPKPGARFDEAAPLRSEFAE